VGVLAVSRSAFRPRRVERFAQLLDRTDGARRRYVRSRADARLNDLVALGHRLGRIPLAAEADPEFRMGLRAMLIATIEREGIGATAVDPEPTIKVPAARHRPVSSADTIRRLRDQAGRRDRPGRSPMPSRRARIAVAVSIAAGTIAVSGMSAASGDAIPGDRLYGVKRSTEKAQLALAGSDVTRGQLYLQFARTRMSEARAVSGDLNELAALLGEMDHETRQGVSLLTMNAVNRRETAGLDVIDAFVAQQRGDLEAFAGSLDPAGAILVRESISLLGQIDMRSDRLRRSVKECDAGTIDTLGPVPCTDGRSGTGVIPPNRQVPGE
jgi:hypothetical protein